MSRDRDFERWVWERLSSWPPARIRQFERWLLDAEEFEFVPAVREAERRRSAELERLRAQLAGPAKASAA